MYSHIEVLQVKHPIKYFLFEIIYLNQSIVSKKASALAKKNNRLVKAGYITRKGKFGVSMRGG